VAKDNRNHSSSLDIPTQLRRRLRRFPDRDQQVSESESGVMIRSRDLEKRIRFEKRLSFDDAGWHILHLNKSGVNR
jgi:hypothetical protein